MKPHRGQWLHMNASVAVAVVLRLWSVSLIACSTLFEKILPHIDDGRPRIDKLAARAIGLKRATGSIPSQCSGWALALQPQGPRALVAPSFDAAVGALTTVVCSPAIGLNSLLAQWLLPEPLIAAGCSKLPIDDFRVNPHTHTVCRPQGRYTGVCANVGPVARRRQPRDRRPPA